MYSWDFYTVLQSWDLFLYGLWLTFVYSVGSIFLGVVFGLIVCFARLSRVKIFNVSARVYLELFRCMPLLVLVLWFYYALPMLTGLSIDNNTAALLSLSLYVSAFYAEIFRGGIKAIDAGQFEAGAAIAMSHAQVMRRIILPQAAKKMLPAFINQSVIQVKNTSLASVISVGELSYMGAVVNGDTYRPLESYTLVAFMYFLLLFPLTQIADRLEKKLRQSD
jgi:polar amino acid transport system permease protein